MPQRKKRIARHAELPRPTKRIRARKADPEKRRYASLRDAAFQGFVREHLCAVSMERLARVTPGRCTGPIECAHIKTRATGGADFGNCVPLCRGHHSAQHILGIRSFQNLYDVDFQKYATELANEYRGAA